MVPQLASATAKGGCLSMEPEKMRPIAGNDRPILISPRGSVVEALGVCGKGLQRTAWEPLADLGALLIACATCSGTCKVAYLPRPPAPISERFLVLLFKNEYLESAVELASSPETARMSPFSRVIGGTMCPQSMRRQLTPTRAQAANMWRLAAGLLRVARTA